MIKAPEEEDVLFKHYSVNEEDLSPGYINDKILGEFNLDDPDIKASARVVGGQETVEELESELGGIRDSQVESNLYQGPGGPFRTSVVSYPISNSKIASGVARRDLSFSQGASDIWSNSALSSNDENYPATIVAITEREDGTPFYGEIVQANVDLHPADSGQDIEETIDSVLGGRANKFYENQEKEFGLNNKRLPRQFDMEVSEK